MQYSIALVAAFAGAAFAAPGGIVSEYTDGQPQAPTGYPTSAAPAPESTVYTTEMITVISCAETVTNCPARSTVVVPTTYPVASATSYAVASSPEVSTSPVASTYAVASPSVVASTPVASVPVAATSPAVSISVQTISTCVPTVIYSTVTVPAAATSAPYPTAPAPSAGSGTGAASGVASGTGAVYPTSSPIQPAIGAASSLTTSFMGVAAAALAALVLA